MHNNKESSLANKLKADEDKKQKLYIKWKMFQFDIIVFGFLVLLEYCNYYDKNKKLENYSGK